MNNIIQLLKEIGFSRLESTIYLALLQETKATGYRIAKLIGKPVANTYKALGTLQKKGAIIIDDSKKSKECIPLPIAEYFKLQEENLKNNRTVIEGQLKKYAAKTPREGIFQIDKIDQVFEKGMQLIRKASQIIMVDLFPYPMSIFKDLLEERAAEGLKVLVKTYEPINLKGCHVVVPGSKAQPLNWNCDWCNIISDDKQFLISFLEKEGSGVLQAIWSKSSYLNIVLGSGYLHEYVLSRISNTINSGESSENIVLELKHFYKEYLHSSPLVDQYKSTLSLTTA
ncbi:MAG: hypothetical protein DRI75_13320 [Bacteroidetes bacterium]|nr:MAG: hypothetical protein DRI75_13320 [Bacteroidota bacterium]